MDENAYKPYPTEEGQCGEIVFMASTTANVTATGGTHTTSGGNDIWTFTLSGTFTPTVTPPVANSSINGLVVSQWMN